MKYFIFALLQLMVMACGASLDALSRDLPVGPEGSGRTGWLTVWLLLVLAASLSSLSWAVATLKSTSED